MTLTVRGGVEKFHTAGSSKGPEYSFHYFYLWLIAQWFLLKMVFFRNRSKTCSVPKKWLNLLKQLVTVVFD